MPPPSAAELLQVQLRQSWVKARWVLDELTDAEYGWEPTPGCWSVRPRGAAQRGWGAGDWVCEDAWPPPDPVPMTTIAWRVVHLAAWTEVYRNWTFEDATLDLRAIEVPGDRSRALEWLWTAQDRFLEAVDTLDDEEAFSLRPAHWGEQVPVVNLVTSMLTEHVHHLAEIGVLRDLHRGHARVQPLPALAEAPLWWRREGDPD